MGVFRRNFFLVIAAGVLLGLFILGFYFPGRPSAEKVVDPLNSGEREYLPDHLQGRGKRLAFHEQPVKLNSGMPFSPGLWIRFSDLKPGDQAWIRATGNVWFMGPAAEVKCSLVATCNHNGINFKYMFIALERENLVPNQWNRVSIDYRIPPAPRGDDVLQAYFWHRGGTELLVDNITIEYFNE
jgi:hypothetical protein